MTEFEALLVAAMVWLFVGVVWVLNRRDYKNKPR